MARPDEGAGTHHRVADVVVSTRAGRERRLVAALVATLLVLVSGIALVVRDERRAASAGAPSVPANEASRLVITRAGRDDIALVRSDDDWRIVAPCALDANDARVEPLLGALGTGALDYPAGEVDLEAAGLDEPLAVVRLDGTATSLGGTDLGGERRYALRGDRVALVPEWTLSLVDGGLSALAEPVPFPEAPVSLRRLGKAGTAPDAPTGTPSPVEPSGAEIDAAPAPARGPTSGATSDAAPGTTLDPGPWAGLAASQIVPWPVPDAPPTTRRTRLEAHLPAGGTRTFELVGNASWNALRAEDGDCAWLFPDDALPTDAYP